MGAILFLHQQNPATVNMGLLKQTWTLTRKNLLIAFNRHAVSTSIRAFILPVAFMIFLSYARNIFVPPSNYGIGSGRPIRTLADGIRAAGAGRETVAFVNNGLAGGAIDRVIDSLSQEASAAGAKVARLNSGAECEAQQNAMALWYSRLRPVKEMEVSGIIH